MGDWSKMTDEEIEADLDEMIKNGILKPFEGKEKEEIMKKFQEAAKNTVKTD